MKNFKNVFCGLAAVAVMTGASAAFAYDYGLIENSTAPGTVLETGFYEVVGTVKISAAEDPGQSALRVAPGATVTINIPFGASLQVFGGPGEGMVGAGAGIEVPKGSKLLVCGGGFLYAQGGAAANGGAGRAGEDAELLVLYDVTDEDLKDLEEWGWLYDEEDLPEPMISVITGAGGGGGNGGGGAAAAIGGKGGRGGAGGAGGGCFPVIRKSQWNGETPKGNPSNKFYSQWLSMLGYDPADTYLYNVMDSEVGRSGKDGAAGSAGKTGGSCGDIVIGEYVQVMAVPGMPGAAGSGGRFGNSYHGEEYELEDTTPEQLIIGGIEILYTALTFDPRAYQDMTEDDIKEAVSELVKWETREGTLWAYGGGGGGGGAGGAGAPSGIGPGGAGGGGGGGAGGGLFVFGPISFELELNGGAGQGGQGVFVAKLDEETNWTTHGEPGEESDHVNALDEDGELQEEGFNVVTNDVVFEIDNDVTQYRCYDIKVSAVGSDRLFTTSLKFLGQIADPKYYTAGAGGAGGAVGKVQTLGTRQFSVSENALVLAGLEEANQKPFNGEVIYNVILGDQTNEVPCGPIVSPVPVPDNDGKFFMGYFTAQDGQGEQYYDLTGSPVGAHELWADLQLYPHFVDEKPADVHQLHFLYFKDETNETAVGEELSTILVQEGKPLPVVGSKRIGSLRGWDCMGAYKTTDDWWYDEYGQPVKEDDDGNAYIYDVDGDTDLRLEFEPKWDAMASMPEDNVRYNYTGEGLSAVDLETDEYEVVGGTSVATNVGSYSTTIRLKEGYEIWDDFLEHPETATNYERTVSWKICRAGLDMIWLPNQVYDWSDTNSTFKVSGKVPAGVTVSYEVTKVLGNGTVEVKAVADGGQNYHSKTMTATWTVPELFRIEKALSHYPWDTTVELDVRVNPAYSAKVFTNRLESVLTPLAVPYGAADLSGCHFFSNAACTVAEAYRGAGTIVVDLKEALANGRDRVAIYMTIDGVPCSFSADIAADTTATVEGGVPTYAVTDPAAVFPINYSWRYVEPDRRNAQALTWLCVTNGGVEVTAPFQPVNELGIRVNDGEVRWTPLSNGTYTVGLQIDCGNFTSNLTAKFAVAYPTGENAPTNFPIVAYVGETGYTTLQAAVDAASKLTGDARRIRVVGDVQTEGGVRIPDDADEPITVVYGRGGVFDATRQFEEPLNEAAKYNGVNALVRYEREEGGGVIPPTVAPEPVPYPSEEADVPECEDEHGFVPVAVAAVPGGEATGLMELCDACGIARVTTMPGVSFTLPENVGIDYVVSNLTAGVACSPDAEGRYVVPTGKDIGIYGIARTGYVLDGAPYLITSIWVGFVLDENQLPTATPIKYNIAYEPGAGEGKCSTNEVAYDQVHTVRTVGIKSGNLKFERTGYSFAGAWTNRAAEVVCEAGTQVSNLTTTAGETFVLEALWTPNVYTVLYRSEPEEEYGQVADDVAYDAEYEIRDNVFAKTGYRFTGWQNEDMGLIQPGDVVSNLVEYDEGECLFTPTWAAANYTVTYHAGEGKGYDVVQSNVYDKAGKVIGRDEAQMSRKHFELIGWTNAVGVAYEFGATYKNLADEEGANVDLFAVWQQVEFPVVVKDVPENVAVSVTVDGAAVLETAEGWYVPDGSTGTVWFVTLDGSMFDVDPIMDVYAVDVEIKGAGAEVTCPGLLPPPPSIGGSLTEYDPLWSTAEIAMTVTNGTASLVTNLMFVFEDRADGSMLYKDKKVPADVLVEKESWIKPGETNVFRYVSIPETDAAFVAVTNGETGTVELTLLLKGASDSDEADRYLGWVAWDAYGYRYFAPVCKSAAVLAEKLTPFLSPLSVDEANAILGGIEAGPEGSELKITAFSVADGKLNGKIAFVAENGAETAPDANAKATLYATDDLTKDFEPCNELELTAEGAFEKDLPTGKAFFKVGIKSGGVLLK